MSSDPSSSSVTPASSISTGSSAAIGTVREAWLFTRGTKSVRIVRAGVSARMYLHIYGPDQAAETHVFDDVITCMQYQSEFERRLVVDGFCLDRFTVDRRSGRERRTSPRGSDRRRLVLLPPPIVS